MLKQIIWKQQNGKVPNFHSLPSYVFGFRYSMGGKTRWEDPYFTAAFKHGSSHGGCNVNGPKVAKFLDG